MIGTDCQGVRGLTCQGGVGFVLYTLNWVNTRWEWGNCDVGNSRVYGTVIISGLFVNWGEKWRVG